MSHTQLPVLFLLTVQSFSISGCREYNQSDFGVDHLVMPMCRVFLCCWKRVFAMASVFSWQNSISLCPASFCTPRPVQFACYCKCFLTSYFCIPVPYKKRTYFWGVSSKRSYRSSQNHSTSVSSALLVGAQTWITVILNVLPWKRTEIILSFFRLHPSTAFWTLLLTMMATPFLLRDSCPQQWI